MFNQFQPIVGSRMALAYFTGGVLLDVWVGVWYFAFGQGSGQPTSQTTWFWVIGLFLTGLTFALIGLTVGLMNRASQRREETVAEKVADAAQAAVVAPPTTIPNVAGVQGVAPVQVVTQPAPNMIIPTVTDDRGVRMAR